MKIQKTIIGCVAIVAIVAGCEALKSGNVANAGKSVGVDSATSAIQSATTSATAIGRQGSDANERYIQILKREDDVDRIFAAAAQIDYGKCSKALVLLRVAYEKTRGRHIIKHCTSQIVPCGTTCMRMSMRRFANCQVKTL